MTEDEAKQKWCPFARQASQFREGAPDAMVVANRSEKDFPLGNCIASECMAWRWDSRVAKLEPHPDGDMCLRWDSEPRGYCGLAGKP